MARAQHAVRLGAILRGHGVNLQVMMATHGLVEGRGGRTGGSR